MTRFVVLLATFAIVASNADATEWKVGGGFRAGLFSYNEDHLDTLKLSWGGQGKALFAKYFGAEFSLQKREDSIAVRIGRIDITTHPIQLSAFYYPIGPRVVAPYLIAGIGWYRLKATGQLDLGPIVVTETISLTESAPHMGAGVEFFVGEHFSAGLDVRRLFFQFETPFGGFSANFLKYAYLINIIANFYF